jgi:hypothetical protein
LPALQARLRFILGTKALEVGIDVIEPNNRIIAPPSSRNDWSVRLAGWHDAGPIAHPDVLLGLMKKERKKAQSVAGRRQADYPPEVPTAMNWNAVFTDPFESAESQ